MKYSVQEKLQLQREAAITNLKSAGGAHHAASGRCAGFWYSAVYSMFAVALLFCCFSCMDLEELNERFYLYSITYNLNNGDWARTDYIAPATYTASQTVKLPSSFYVKRDGYRFDGWYDNKEFSGSAVSGWEAGEKSSDITLWAKWISSEKNFISFMFAAGTNSMLTTDIQGIINENSNTIIVSVPSGTNMSALKATFKAASTSSVAVGGVSQKSGETINDFTKPVVYTITAADGSVREYTVTVSIREDGEYGICYDLNHGTWVGECNFAYTYAKNQAVTLPAKDNIKRTGYTFAGWYDNKELSGSAISGWKAGDKSADITLWAKWTYGMVLPVSAAADAIAALTENEISCLVMIYGELNEGDISKIKTALNTAEKNGADVRLNMGNCTGLKTLPAAAFANCKNLIDVTIPGSVTSIGDKAFYGCLALTSVTIPGSVTSIGVAAFYVCPGLTSVTIPDSVTSIGDGVFHGCSGLTEISVAADNTAYTAIDGILFTKNEETLLCYPFSKSDNTYSIPAGVKSIRNGAFTGCPNLTEISVAADNPAYTAVDGVLFTKNGERLVCYPGGKSNKEYSIPDNVIEINKFAFFCCQNLTSVTIPANVTYIGNSAFCSCQNLTSMTIPVSVTSIGCCVFYGCSSLESLRFSNSAGWYMTESESDWEHKTGGTLAELSDMSKNVQHLESPAYYRFYWYKK